jgi:phage shock protein A
MIAFAAKMRSQQDELNREKQQLDEAKALVRREENENWNEKNRVRAEQMRLENEVAIMKRDMELVKQRENQVKVLEERRRRNRFVSSSEVVNSSTLTVTIQLGL